MRRFDASIDPDFDAAFAAFLAESRADRPPTSTRAVAEVIAAVRAEGLPAVLRFGRRFDGVELTEAGLRVSRGRDRGGAAALPGPVREAIAFAAGRIRAYHERQRPADAWFTDEAGVELGWRWTPLDAVGVYVPGGRAAYPSTVLMNAVPGAVAGVERIAMVTPPGGCSRRCWPRRSRPGVDEIWRVGGAQAVAALAYGRRTDRARSTRSSAPATPMSRRPSAGSMASVGIDALAGPSEIVVVADGANDPAWIAADLLSQAEHDPDAQSILITDDAAFAARGVAAVAAQLAAPRHRRGRRGLLARPRRGGDRAAGRARRAWSTGSPPNTSSSRSTIPSRWPTGCATPARSSSAATRPRRSATMSAGSNHVLPTSRAARFSSGLSTLDFLKRTSIVKCDAAASPAWRRPPAPWPRPKVCPPMPGR